MNVRFTLDGSGELEERLERICQKVLAGAQRLVPAPEFEALVLGGGYGRGQGGVLQTDAGDRPYNDLEFYVFLRGNILLNEPKYRGLLNDLGAQLSPEAGLHVEFKVYSVEKLRQSAISMFSYDLVAGHKMIFGSEDIFKTCRHHLAAEQIPPNEATRLLFNRCSGLLLAKNYLRQKTLAVEQQDFIGRNIAKAQLAFGDAVLTVFGKYHWSCVERAERLKTLAVPEAPSWLPEILPHHAAGVDFKLHPRRETAPKPDLERRHAEAAALGLRLWRWAESRRLTCPFESARNYALSRTVKCPESRPWRNALLSLRAFGSEAAFDGYFLRYPRERLMNALCLLLWDDQATAEPALQRQLQKLLHSKNIEWPDFIHAYQVLWQNYG